MNFHISSACRSAKRQKSLHLLALGNLRGGETRNVFTPAAVRGAAAHLLADAQLTDDFAVPVAVGFLQVIQQAAAL